MIRLDCLRFCVHNFFLQREKNITGFKKVPVNTRQRFDPVSGVFTVPQDGVFSFEIDVLGCRPYGEQYIHLNVNGQHYQKIRYSPLQSNLRSNFHATTLNMPLKEGDKTNLDITECKIGYKPDNEYHFTFIGKTHY